MFAPSPGRLRSLGALGLVFTATLTIAFALGGSAEWHKHLQAGAELFHLHGHFGAHTHPELSAEQSSGPVEAPSDSDRQPAETADFVSFSGPAFEPAAAAFELTSVLAEGRESSPDPIAGVRRSWIAPRSSRAPPHSL